MPKIERRIIAPSSPHPERGRELYDSGTVPPFGGEYGIDAIPKGNMLFMPLQYQMDGFIKAPLPGILSPDVNLLHGEENVLIPVGYGSTLPLIPKGQVE